MGDTAVKMGAGGRVVIPAEVRSALGVGPGDTLILVVEPDGIRLLTPEQAVRRAQGLVKKHLTEGQRLSEELLAERRDEVASDAT